MILYFTATGNSLRAAEKIASATKDRLFDIGRAVRHGVFKVELAENEPDRLPRLCVDAARCCGTVYPME